MADEDVLAGVPEDVQPEDDDAMAMEEAAEEAADERDAEQRERAAARARQQAAEEEEDAREAARARREAAEAEDEEEMEAEDQGAGLPKKIGKRKIIHHALDPSLLHGAAGGGAIAPDDAEMERRRARAAKFEMPVPEVAPPAAPVVPAQMLTMEEIQAREERAKKFESVPMNPLDSLVTMAGDKGFWERRRDAATAETARFEAVHVFGTDRMSTEDLLLYFIEPGVTTQEAAPQWVEWVNDSSANVVFSAAEACTEAMGGRTIALLPSHTGIDPQSWRTTPAHLAHAGKGLQLIFRIATTEDVKPAKRAASRWYGELEGNGRRTSGGKQGGVADRRGKRQQASAPYGRGPSKAIAAITAQGREAGKKSLAEAIAIGVAKEEHVPSLAETIQMKQGPTLAQMAAHANGPTLADMATAANDAPSLEPTLADMASGRRIEVQPGAGAGASKRGGDLRSRLGKKPEAHMQAAATEEAPGGMFSYEAAKSDAPVAEGDGGDYAMGQ